MNYLVARLTGIQPNSSRITNENSTLDDFSRTFPLKHNLYFDFTHDSGHQHHGNFARRWGLTQFLWTTGPPQNHTTWNRFAEWYWRKFCAPPLWPPTAPRAPQVPVPTTYMLLNNQRTVPLGVS